MAASKKPKKLKISKIKSISGLQPLKDDVFMYLLEQALSGKINVYCAAVPLNLIQPFDKDYDPRMHLIGSAAIRQEMERWSNGNFSCCWVYPRAEKFILSDDYITYFAAVEGQPDCLPCFVLGDPNIAEVKDIKGPLPIESIKKYLGFA